jgi:hypothetical protein
LTPIYDKKMGKMEPFLGGSTALFAQERRKCDLLAKLNFASPGSVEGQLFTDSLVVVA